MKKQKAKDNFWFVLGIINLLALTVPASFYLQADSFEDQILGILVLFAVGLLLAIADSVSILVAYSQ